MGNTWARDETCTTPVTQATPVTTESLTTWPRGNSHKLFKNYFYKPLALCLKEKKCPWSREVMERAHASLRRLDWTDLGLEFRAPSSHTLSFSPKSHMVECGGHSKASTVQGEEQIDPICHPPCPQTMLLCTVAQATSPLTLTES